VSTTELTVSASGNRSVICPGDSGGPWLRQGTTSTGSSSAVRRIAGVSSRGDCATVAIATRTDAYLDFITSNLVPDPIPQFVSFFSAGSEQFVTAEAAGTSPLIANRAVADRWEVFDVEDQHDGTVAIRSMTNDKYVTADNAGALPLIANRDTVGTWERFIWVSLGGKDFALKSLANGKFVSASLVPIAPGIPANTLVAIAGAIGKRETFTAFRKDPVFVAPPSSIAIRALANQKLVTAENAGATPLIANRTSASQWETFTVRMLGGDEVALFSLADNKWVTAESAGNSPLIANRDAIQTWETFHWISLGGERFALRANANGRYVSADNAGQSPLIANRDTVGLWETFEATAHTWTPPSGCGGTVCGTRCCAAGDWCGIKDHCCNDNTCTPECDCDPPPQCAGTLCGTRCCASGDWCGINDRCCNKCIPGQCDC